MQVYADFSAVAESCTELGFADGEGTVHATLDTLVWTIEGARVVCRDASDGEHHAVSLPGRAVALAAVTARELWVLLDDMLLVRIEYDWTQLARAAS